MNRREIKLTAKSRADQAGKPAKLLTLVTLITQAVLLGLQYAANELSAHIGSSSNYLSATVASGARSLLLSLAIGLVIQAVMQMIRAGYTLGALRIHRQEEVPMNTLLEGFYMPLRVILLEIMHTLLLIAWSYAFLLPISFLVSLGYGLFASSADLTAMLTDPTNAAVGLTIGVGVLTVLVMWIVSYRYRMIWFLLMDHPDASPWQLLRTSSAMTQGHRWELFLLDLSFLPWFLLCGLTLGILLIWKGPYFTAAYAGAYESMCEDLKARQQRAQELRQQYPPHS